MVRFIDEFEIGNGGAVEARQDSAVGSWQDNLYHGPCHILVSSKLLGSPQLRSSLGRILRWPPLVPAEHGFIFAKGSNVHYVVRKASTRRAAVVSAIAL